jgi:hypothetical protein
MRAPTSKTAAEITGWSHSQRRNFDDIWPMTASSCLLVRQLAHSCAASARNNEHIGRQVKHLLIERRGRQLTAPSIGLGAQL